MPAASAASAIAPGTILDVTGTWELVLTPTIMPQWSEELRQLGLIDMQGRTASFTGKDNDEWAGGRQGPDFTIQGNILVSEETVAAMARAFRETDGILGEKLMRALEEGQAAGEAVDHVAQLAEREGIALKV